MRGRPRRGAGAEFAVRVPHPTPDLRAGERALEEQEGMPIFRPGIPPDTEPALRLALAAVEELATRERFAIFHGFYLISSAAATTPSQIERK